MRSVKEKCLNRLIFLSEAHLRTTLSIFIGCYLQRRNHQGIEIHLIGPLELLLKRGRIRNPPATQDVTECRMPSYHSPVRTPPLASTTTLLAVAGTSDRVTFPPGQRTCTPVGDSGVPRTWTVLFCDQKPLPA